VLLPERNRRDLEDIPEEARQRMTIEWVGEVDQVLHKALAAAGAGPAQRA
jgi:ATP-dependent Lon protease